MPEIELNIQHASGLHARPASVFVRTAASFPCEIKVTNLNGDAKAVNAKSILSVLGLGVNQGCQIRIEANGESADAALSALKGLIENNFGEKASV